MSVRRALAIVIALMLFGLVAILVVASGKPDQYQIVRRVVIDAPPESAFARVGDLSRWEEWSPWKYRDPNLISKPEGPKVGVGSKQIWASPKTGSGEFEITAFELNNLVRYRLTHSDWDAVSTGEIRVFGLSQGKSEVSWKIEGKNTLSNKVIWTVFGMEKAMAADLDLGLSLLKAKCEAEKASKGAH